MATKESTNPKGVCEKLFDAISVKPAYHSLRRISHNPKDPAASHAAPSSVPSNANGTQITHHISPGKPEKPMTSSEKAQKAKVSRPIDPTPTPGKKVAEVVPTKADPPPPKMKTQKEKPVAPPTKPGSDPADGKPRSKMNAGAAMKAVVQHGKEVAGKVHLPRGRQEQEKVEPAEKGVLSNMSEKASDNEKASDYIARAKYKIRNTTTLLGGGYEGGRHGRGTGHNKE